MASQKILLVNGHGSNTPLVDLVARRTVLETNSLCAALNYFNFGIEAFNRVKETPMMAHADEFETSLYLHLAPERVRKEKAVADGDVVGKYVSSDSTTPFVRFNDYWGRWTEVGVHGDPTRATAEKGEIVWEAILSGLIEFVDEWHVGRLPSTVTSTNCPFDRRFNGERDENPGNSHSGLCEVRHLKGVGTMS